MGRRARLLLLATVLGAAGADRISASDPGAAGAVSYRRPRLFELALQADVIVAGEITQLGGETFELRIEERIAGEPIPEEHVLAPGSGSSVRVRRFDDWTCGSRWTDYADGQRVLLFLARPEEPPPIRGLDPEPLEILGGGDEGEMALTDSEVVARNFRVRDFAWSNQLEPRTYEDPGTRLPREEFVRAIRVTREEIEVRTKRSDSGWKTYQYGPRRSAESLDRFAATSRCARHLVGEARTSNDWWGSVPGPDTSLDPNAASALALRLTLENEDDRWVLPPSALRACGDFDGDGIEDLACAASHPLWETNLSLIPGRLHGRFGETSRFRDQAGITGPRLPAPDSLAVLAEFSSADSQVWCLGSPQWPDARALRGAIWLVRVGRDGRIRSRRQIAPGEAFESAGVRDGTGLGAAIESLGDLDGDGTVEVVLGVDSVLEHELTLGRSVYVASISPTGEVARVRAIEGRARGFCESGSRFGDSLARLGDLDGDGVTELAIGVPDDEDGGEVRGSVWIVFLDRDGGVKRAQKISEWSGGLDAGLRDWTCFGRALCAPGDLDRDGVPDLIVGTDYGLFSLLLARDGTVRAHRRLEFTNTPEWRGSTRCETLTWIPPSARAGDGFVIAGIPLHGERTYVTLASDADGVLRAR